MRDNESSTRWEKIFKEDMRKGIKYSNKSDEKEKNFLIRILDETNKLIKVINKKNKKILDIGCGFGTKTAYLARKNQEANFIGIDSSKTAINEAKKIKLKNLKFSVQKAQKLKYESRNFDAIISIATYHAFNEKEREGFIKEAYRVLKKDGILVLLTKSYKSDDIDKSHEIENGTYLQRSGIYFHLAKKDEILRNFKRFKILKLKHVDKNYFLVAKK